MLRRRHCRCNLLLLLAVCIGSGIVLLKWGFIDAVKRTTDLSNHAMSDMHGADASGVISAPDDNVVNFAPPLHGAPPEDKEEEEEEERYKAKHSKVKTTTAPPRHKHTTTHTPVDSDEANGSEEEDVEEEVNDDETSKPEGDAEIEEIKRDDHVSVKNDVLKAAPEIQDHDELKVPSEGDVEHRGESEPKKDAVDNVDNMMEQLQALTDTSREQGGATNVNDKTEQSGASKDTARVQDGATNVDGKMEQLEASKDLDREQGGSSRVSSTLLQDLGIKTTALPSAEYQQKTQQRTGAPPAHVTQRPKTTPHVVKSTTMRHTTHPTPNPTPYEKERRLPKVILIGAVSCPVDVVVSFLHLHPDIVLGGVVNFFNDDINYKRGLTWYARQMPMSYPYQVTIDVNPTYYLASQTPERIFKMNPHTKLIFVVCDPIMRALAHHVNNSQEKQFDSLAFHSSKDGKVNERYEAIQYSLYFYHMQRWLKIFPKKQLLVIDVGTLRKNLHSELSNIEDFLDIQHNILNVPVDLDPSVMKKLQKFFQAHNEDFFKAIGRRFEWQ